MSEKHSPAPWRLNWKVAGGGQLADVPTLHYICIESANINTANDPLRLVGYMRPSDARLIAAAPELLAACRRAIELLKICGANVDPNEPILKAIAKTEGHS